MNYAAIYSYLMASAKNRERFVGAERHHIVPKALGGNNCHENLVWLTAREHYVAHYLLWKVHRNKSMARAFTLMARVSGRMSSKSYEEAKNQYASSMAGDKNVAKRQDVRQKISFNNAKYWLGKKRPDHSLKMKLASPFCDIEVQKARAKMQVGAGNPIARPVKLSNDVGENLFFDTMTDAAKHLGVSVQAVKQAQKRCGKTCGWSVGDPV